MIRLSVLDQSVAVSGRGEDDAIRETLALAQHCDALGYHRFWVSEHHNHPSIAGSAPEILMAAIAVTTRRIRVGSAGIMLPHYSALKVAEQFRVLEALAPGRIDLGVGRAPGSDRHTAFALNPAADQAADHFPAQVRDLLAWVAGAALPADHPFQDVQAHPAGPDSPEPWVLGSSDYGAQVAAHFGLPYCFAHFITDGRGAETALALYRRHFRPSARFAAPVPALCLWALAADSEAAARELIEPRIQWRIARDRGLLQPLLSPAAAAGFALTEAEQVRAARLRDTVIAGTAATVGQKLRSLAAATGAEDVVVLTWSHDAQARRRSYELLAGEFGL